MEAYIHNHVAAKETKENDISTRRPAVEGFILKHIYDKYYIILATKYHICEKSFRI